MGESFGLMTEEPRQGGLGPQVDGEWSSTGPYEHPAAGWGAALTVGKVLYEQRQPIAGTKAMFTMNHPKSGFDCPGCAWPDDKGVQFYGISVRDYFAAKAMAAMITTSGGPSLFGLGGCEPETAKAAYRIADAMLEASEKLDFETAARYRDRIRALTQIHAHQDINVEGMGDADALAAHQAGGHTAIQVYFFRGGRNYGTRAYFPSHDKTQGEAEVLAAFVSQFYDGRTPPPQRLKRIFTVESDTFMGRKSRACICR